MGYTTALTYIVITINIILTVFFAGSYLIGVGLFMAILSMITICLFKENQIGYFIIQNQIKSYDKSLLLNNKEHNALLVSIAFLTLALKLGAAIALIIEGAAVIIIAFCILLASGWLFLGRESGMSVGLAYLISKLVMKIYLFCNSLADKLAMAVVRVEFSLLKIEER